MRGSETHNRHIFMVKEEAISCSESRLGAAACRSYRRLVASPDDKEADFEVPLSPRAGVIRVIQKEPLPQDTVGCKRTTDFINAPTDKTVKIQSKMPKIAVFVFSNWLISDVDSVL